MSWSKLGGWRELGASWSELGASWSKGSGLGGWRELEASWDAGESWEHGERAGVS